MMSGVARFRDSDISDQRDIKSGISRRASPFIVTILKSLDEPPAFISRSKYFDGHPCNADIRSVSDRPESIRNSDRISERTGPLHRLRILQMLVLGRYTFGKLADACGIISHMASELLRQMQCCGLLTHQKDGRRNDYQIADATHSNFMTCIESRFDSTYARAFCIPAE